MTTSVHTPPPVSRAPVGPRGISVHGNRGIKVVRSCTICRPAAEIYAFCRQPGNLPQLLGHPVEIMPITGRPAQWRVRVPLGLHALEWDATIINDEPDQLLAWRSLAGAPVPNAGTIRFEPVAACHCTEVTVQLEYDPPGGKLAAFVGTLAGDAPRQRVEDALWRLKSLMEGDAHPPPPADFTP